MSRPLRVLVLINSLGYGGAERMLERMVLSLSGSGRVEYTVCSLEDVGPIGERLRAKGIEVLAFGARGGTVRVILKGVRELRRVLRDREFDILHSFLYRSHCAARIAKALFRPSLPLVSSERCVADNRSWFQHRLNGLMSRWSDRVIAVSHAVQETVVSRDGIPRRKVVVVRNGIEAASPSSSQGARVRKVLGIGPSEMVLLMLGRLHREKGPDLLFEAVAHLMQSDTKTCKVLLVGDGPERESLENLANQLGVRASVYFAGARGRVSPWIEASDILVLPSREEGLPVAPLEAMAREKPVVGTRVGGTPEVVLDGITGILVPPEDKTALASALTRLLGDREAGKEMGRRGRKRVTREFSIDKMTEAIQRVYLETLESAGRQGHPEGMEALARPRRG